MPVTLSLWRKVKPISQDFCGLFRSHVLGRKIVGSDVSMYFRFTYGWSISSILYFSALGRYRMKRIEFAQCLCVTPCVVMKGVSMVHPHLTYSLTPSDSSFSVWSSSFLLYASGLLVIYLFTRTLLTYPSRFKHLMLLLSWLRVGLYEVCAVIFCHRFVLSGI